MDILHALALMVVGMVAGFLNVVGGGGSSLTLPALILLGLDSSLANGTNRIAILIQNIFAILGFQQEKRNKFKLSLKYALITLPGALIGAIAAIQISNVWFQRILALIIILIVASFFIPKKYGTQSEENPNTLLGYIALFALGFYGGFIQVGIGLLLMASIYHLFKKNLIEVNVHKVFIVLLYTLPALIIFIITDNVHWLFGLVLAAGNGLGGWLAARISVRKGEKFIKMVLAVILVLMALKLIIQNVTGI